MASVKEQMQEALRIPDDHFDTHCSDLYVKFTKDRHDWLKDNYEHFQSVQIFKSNPKCSWDGSMAIEIPFAAGIGKGLF